MCTSLSEIVICVCMTAFLTVLVDGYQETQRFTRDGALIRQKVIPNVLPFIVLTIRLSDILLPPKTCTIQSCNFASSWWRTWVLQGRISIFTIWFHFHCGIDYIQLADKLTDELRQAGLQASSETEDDLEDRFVRLVYTHLCGTYWCPIIQSAL